MKFFLISMLALIACATAAQLPDSATQGPNPQDIATPEPEYIDIDLPEPAAAPAPAPIQSRSSFVAAPRPVPRPVAAASTASFAARAPQQQQFFAPQRSYHPAPQNQLPGHSFHNQNGYQYRRPVFVRRVYRRRY